MQRTANINLWLPYTHVPAHTHTGKERGKRETETEKGRDNF